VYQPVGIVFKGSGFYATDHRSPSGTARSNGKSKESEDKKVAEGETSSKKTTSDE
jgi:predicted nucleic acid-binding Zn ribbon protein